MESTEVLDRARHTIAALVRGDGMLGMIPEPRATAEAMMQSLWQIAPSEPAAYELLGRCYYAVLVPDGAFDGVYEGGLPTGWPGECLDIEDENGAVEAALRCFYLAARRGLVARVKNPLIDLGTHSTPENAALVLALFEGEPADAHDAYLRALLHHAAGRSAEAAALLRGAADQGEAAAMFELSLYATHGIAGPVDARAARAWLERAAERGHTRALYNLGAAYASGADGAVDYPRAAVLYRQAADAGHGQASATLAAMILLGQIAGTREEAAGNLDFAVDCGFDPAPMLEAAGVVDPRGVRV